MMFAGIYGKKGKRLEAQELLAAAGYDRTWSEIQTAYHRWKGTAKKNISCCNRYSAGTGGGPYASERSEEDFFLAEVSPGDFEEDDNPLDSDGVVSNKGA